MSYESTAEEIVKRIESLAKVHPEVMGITDAWDLLKYPDFKVDDLQPSAFQVSWALGAARAAERRRKARREPPCPAPAVAPAAGFSVDVITLADELGKAYSRATGNETLDPVAIAVARELLSSRVVAVIFK